MNPVRAPPASRLFPSLHVSSLLFTFLFSVSLLCVSSYRLLRRQCRLVVVGQINRRPAAAQHTPRVARIGYIEARAGEEGDDGRGAAVVGDGWEKERDRERDRERVTTKLC